MYSCTKIFGSIVFNTLSLLDWQGNDGILSVSADPHRLFRNCDMGQYIQYHYSRKIYLKLYLYSPLQFNVVFDCVLRQNVAPSPICNRSK